MTHCVSSLLSNMYTLTHLSTAIADTINKFKEQKQLLESRLEFTADIQKEASGTEGIVDIREEYDPEKEAKWRGNSVIKNWGWGG